MGSDGSAVYLEGDVYSHANPQTPPSTITNNPNIHENGTPSYNSPLIGAGVTNSNVNFDIRQYKYKTPPTVGAYEFNPYMTVQRYVV